MRPLFFPFDPKRQLSHYRKPRFKQVCCRLWYLGCCCFLLKLVTRGLSTFSSKNNLPLHFYQSNHSRFFFLFFFFFPLFFEHNVTVFVQIARFKGSKITECNTKQSNSGILKVCLLTVSWIEVVCDVRGVFSLAVPVHS